MREIILLNRFNCILPAEKSWCGPELNDVKRVETAVTFSGYLIVQS